MNSKIDINRKIEESIIIMDKISLILKKEMERTGDIADNEKLKKDPPLF